MTIVNVALARIGSGLGGSRSELQRVVDAYALVPAAGMLGAGNLADRDGSTRLFLAGPAAILPGSLAIVTNAGAGVMNPLTLPLAALTPFAGRLVGRFGPRVFAGLGLAASGVGYLGTALVGGSNIDPPSGWAFLFIAEAGMGIAVNSTSRQVVARRRIGFGADDGLLTWWRGELLPLCGSNSPRHSAT